MKVKKDYVVGGCYIWRDDATTNSCYDWSSVASPIMDLKEIKLYDIAIYNLNQENCHGFFSKSYFLYYLNNIKWTVRSRAS